MASPPTPPLLRTGLTNFLPLSSDDVNPVSTRGQRLPSIIQNRSSASLFSLGRRVPVRRASATSIGSHDEESAFADDILSRRPSIPEIDARRMALGPESLMTPQMRSMRLIGKSNPRYQWHQYWKSDEELKQMRKPIRKYYERNNYLIAQYIYIDRLLDSSLPHSLIQEYNQSNRPGLGTMNTITEESSSAGVSSPSYRKNSSSSSSGGGGGGPTMENALPRVIKRTPQNLYKVPAETSPLLEEEGEIVGPFPDIKYQTDEDVDSSSPVVTIAIYINLVANVLLLAAKVVVIILTSSLSVLASLVDAALDFLSTAIVWTTTKLIARQDQYAYPIGRRRLEPVGVLVFSVIMITSFFQVALECFQRLVGPDHSVVSLGIPAVAIMLSTVLIKGFCYFWCRLVRNSSVQALAQDAQTDVVFNSFSIVFPLVGWYARVWWLDALGGLLLSLFVIFNWSVTSSEHVRNLCGAAASADQRNVLLYLTMRFAKTIRSIQGIQAYHTGDKLNVEVDIVLDENMSLRDTHDLGESLQYLLESVPTVDRAFVHADYASKNLPSHMNQQA